MVNRFISILIQYLKNDPLPPKRLIAPSRRVGYQWLDSVTRAGQPVLNTHVTTLRKTALEMALPAMERAGFKFLRETHALIIVHELFIKLKESGDGYLTGLNISRGLAKSLLASIRDMRLAGITGGTISTGGFEVNAKGDDIRRLLLMYEEHLRTKKLADYADILKMAVERLVAEPSCAGDDSLFLMPSDAHEELKGLERKLWGAIPESNRRVIEVDHPGEIPAEGAADASLLGFISDVENAPQPAGDDTAAIFRAVGEVNEVREVLRRCYGREIPFDDVEILYTDSETYLPLLYEVAGGLKTDDADEINITFEEGIPLRYSRPGRALRAWLEWVRNDYPQSVLVRMVQDGLLEIDTGDEDVSFSELAGALRSVPIGGRERYLSKIDEEASAIGKRVEYYRTKDDEEFVKRVDVYKEKAKHLDLVRQFIAVLLKLSENINGYEEVLRAAEIFIGEFARCANRMDEYCREYLMERFADLKDCFKVEEIPGFEITEWLEDIAVRSNVGGMGPMPGCIYAVPLRSGGHTGRKHTFVIGFDDTRFPGAGKQDPLLLDDERMALSPELSTSSNRMAVKLRDYEYLMTRLRGSITLGYCCRNLKEDREMFPSPVLLASYRVLSGNHEGDYESFIQWVSEPCSFAPSNYKRCIDINDWWIWRLCGEVIPSNADEIIMRRFPHLKQGRVARQARKSEVFTEYDGYVPEAGGDLDPTLPDAAPLSASRLEKLGSCPMEYFFRYVLGVEPPEEFEIDPAAWLDALQKGELLHTVFRKFMYTLQRKGLHPDFARDWPALEAILHEEIGKWRDIQPPPNEDVFNRMVSELILTAQIFLEEEVNHCEIYQPLYFEASIGLKPEGEGTPIDSWEPVNIKLPSGKQIRVYGRIDRVDGVIAGNGKLLAVWDYKTGSKWGYDPENPFREGRRIQSVLYLQMLNAHLKTVKPESYAATFGYYFVSKREHGERIIWGSEDLGGGSDLLQNLCDMIAKGCFPFTDDAKADTRYSKYIFSSGNKNDLSEMTIRKMGNPENLTLKPFSRLRGKEPVDEQ
ncbi:MAG: hypothetical protein GF307_03520 [candidate division Zixibacteria bacterium]|nr:hypothetical protein [candidate division Zixibacteria bacterium]